MTTSKKMGWWALTLAGALAVGCGGNGSSSTTGPSAGQTAAAQQADAGSSSIQQTMDAANNAILENGAPGSTSAQTTPSKTTTGGMTINFQGTVNLTVDLDALNSAGQDAYPNATGKFSVSATGTITGNSGAGQATYAVTVTWLTDGTFTDPANGDSATVASGSHWDYSLVVQWSKTDDLNWSISATSDVSGALNATVTHQGTTWTVTGTVTRHAALSLSETAGVTAFAFAVSGQRVVVVTDGTVTHTVVTTISALDHIVIEVDGVTFGPYTLAQILWWWAFHCNA